MTSIILYAFTGQRGHVCYFVDVVLAHDGAQVDAAVFYLVALEFLESLLHAVED